MLPILVLLQQHKLFKQIIFRLNTRPNYIDLLAHTGSPGGVGVFAHIGYVGHEVVGHILQAGHCRGANRFASPKKFLPFAIKSPYFKS